MADVVDLNELTLDEPKSGDVIVITRKTNNSIIETAFKTDVEYLKFTYASPEEIEKITEGVKNIYPLINEEIAKYATDEDIALKSMKLNDADYYRSKIITYENLSTLLESYLTVTDLSVIISEIIANYESKAYELESDLANVAVQGRAAVTTITNSETVADAVYSVDVSSNSSSNSSSK